MPTAKKPMPSSAPFSPSEVAAAKAAAADCPSRKGKLDWQEATVTPGGGVAATMAHLRKTRGPNKHPSKEQVAIRLDRDLVGALRASGPGWQTRVNAALKDWLATQPVKGKPRGQNVA